MAGWWPLADASASPRFYLLSAELLAESRLATATGDRDGAALAYRRYLALRQQVEARPLHGVAARHSVPDLA
jgi:hypothetical protein